MSEQTLRNVPADHVGQVVQDFVDSNAHEITATRNANGTWDITAQIDD